MALVTGPLHSDSASGKFAGSMVFATNKGRKYVRSLVIPSNPKSAAQLGVRSMMKYLAQLWSSIVSASGASWDTIAESRNISNFAAFIGENLTRWQSNQGPTQAFPAAEAGITLNPDSVGIDGVILSASGEAGYATLEATPDTDDNSDAVGAILYRGAAAPDKNWAAAVAVFPVIPGVVWNYTDSPLDAGTYHYKLAYFGEDGVISALSAADVTAVVT